MNDTRDFDFQSFLPYLLNQAAETTSSEFGQIYKSKYGLLRTDWRVMFHLGRYGSMTAKEICARARLHKTKVSRSVAAMEKRRFVKRETMKFDKRHEELSLTPQGRSIFKQLLEDAKAYDDKVVALLSEHDVENLQICLKKLAKLA